METESAPFLSILVYQHRVEGCPELSVDCLEQRFHDGDFLDWDGLRCGRLCVVNVGGGSIKVNLWGMGVLVVALVFERFYVSFYFLQKADIDWLREELEQGLFICRRRERELKRC